MEPFGSMAQNYLVNNQTYIIYYEKPLPIKQKIYANVFHRNNRSEIFSNGLIIRHLCEDANKTSLP